MMQHKFLFPMQNALNYKTYIAVKFPLNLNRVLVRRNLGCLNSKTTIFSACIGKPVSFDAFDLQRALP